MRELDGVTHRDIRFAVEPRVWVERTVATARHTSEPVHIPLEALNLGLEPGLSMCILLSQQTHGDYWKRVCAVARGRYTYFLIMEQSASCVILIML